MSTRDKIALLSLLSVLVLDPRALCQQGGIEEHVAVPSNPRDLRLPPPRAIAAPPVSKVVLSNGLTAYLLPDRELPIVHFSLLLRVGWRQDPPEKVGLAFLTGAALRAGGTRLFPNDEFDEKIEGLGAMFDLRSSDDATTLNLSVLKEHLDAALSLVIDLLVDPAFPEPQLELARLKRRDALARANDNLQSILVREFWQLLFGKDSPYVREPSLATLAAVQRQDLVAFRRRFVQPQHAVAGLRGDFDAARMRDRLESTLGRWKRGDQPRPPLPDWRRLETNPSGLYLIPKKNTAESWFIIGRPGGMRRDPDYPALSVMNAIFGGGMSSRLIRAVRSERGLSYAIGSQWNAGWDRPGVFTIMGGTKPQSTMECLRVIKAEMERVASGPVEEDELARAKESLRQSFVVELESAGRLMQKRIALSFFGYPDDYLDWYVRRLGSVTKAEVEGLARRYFRFSDFVTMVIGDEGNFDAPLSSLGEVTKIAPNR